MFTELKSSFVYYGCPIIYLTINPGDRHSPCKDSKHSGVNSRIRSSMGFAHTDHIVALFAFFLYSPSPTFLVFSSFQLVYNLNLFITCSLPHHCQTVPADPSLVRSHP